MELTTGKYILDESGNPVPERNLITWAKWYEDSMEQRQVAETYLPLWRAYVSTVFLAIDHQLGSGPPLLWETMVFEGMEGIDIDRCSGNREQAEAMHVKMVNKYTQRS
jgi:hypothetical protein